MLIYRALWELRKSCSKCSCLNSMPQVNHRPPNQYLFAWRPLEDFATVSMDSQQNKWSSCICSGKPLSSIWQLERMKNYLAFLTFSQWDCAVFLSRILGLFFFLIWCTNEDLIVYKLFDKFFVGQIFKLLYFAQWILISSLITPNDYC